MWHGLDACRHPRKPNFFHAKKAAINKGKQQGTGWLAMYTACFGCGNPQGVCDVQGSGGCQFPDIVFPTSWAIFHRPLPFRKCNELDHVRPRRPSPGWGRIIRRIIRRITRRIVRQLSDYCQTIVRGLSGRSGKGVTSRYPRGIKVGEGCWELRSLTEQLVYLRLATIVLVYCRTPSHLLSTSCYPVLPGPFLS